MKARLSGLVGDHGPTRSDHRQQDVTCPHCLPEGLRKIGTRLDCIDVDKNGFGPETLFQPVRQAAGPAGTVFPPITDEDAAHRHAGYEMLAPIRLRGRRCSAPYSKRELLAR